MKKHRLEFSRAWLFWIFYYLCSSFVSSAHVCFDCRVLFIYPNEASDCGLIQFLMSRDFWHSFKFLIKRAVFKDF
jgi:hypothetical protein